MTMCDTLVLQFGVALSGQDEKYHDQTARVQEQGGEGGVNLGACRHFSPSASYGHLRFWLPRIQLPTSTH